MEKNTINITTLENTPNVFFCSDLHFAHRNICSGTTSWNDIENDCRKFETIEKMNYAIIKAINDRVGQEDILYFLGDFSFGGIENVWNARKQIICKNIHVVYGNHDHHIEKNHILPNSHWDYDNNVIADGKPNNNVGTVLARELFKSVNEMLSITIDKQEIVLCHYPLEQWKNMDRGSWHLFGHTHGKLKELVYKRMDVGLDATGFKVLSFDEIKKIMMKREIKIHH